MEHRGCEGEGGEKGRLDFYCRVCFEPRVGLSVAGYIGKAFHDC